MSIRRYVRQGCARRSPCPVHQRPHLPDGAVKSAEDRLSDQEMADVQLDDGRNGRNRRHGVEAEAMTGMAFQPNGFGMGCGDPDTVELAQAGGVIFGIAVGAGVKFDHRSTDGSGRIQLDRIGIDEQRYPDAGGAKIADHGSQRVAVAGDVQAAFGRTLFPALGDDAGRMRPVMQCYRQHLARRGHLKVQRQVDLAPQTFDVAVGDVAPVFPQMGRDAVGTRLSS